MLYMRTGLGPKRINKGGTVSEAFGRVLIQAPGEILENLRGDGGDIAWKSMERLFGHAGIASLKDSHFLLEYKEGEDFPHEGVEIRDGFIEITIFGDEWMHAMAPLATKGKGIQVYGVIHHEHGYLECYALNAAGESFVDGVDFEGDEEVDEGELMRKWLTFVPREIRDKFPNVFAFDEEA